MSFLLKLSHPKNLWCNSITYLITNNFNLRQPFRLLFSIKKKNVTRNKKKLFNHTNMQHKSLFLMSHHLSLFPPVQVSGKIKIFFFFFLIENLNWDSHQIIFLNLFLLLHEPKFCFCCFFYVDWLVAKVVSLFCDVILIASFITIHTGFIQLYTFVINEI